MLMNKLLLKGILFGAMIIMSSSPKLNAEDRLLIVGDATWGGWSLDKTSVMVKKSDEVFTYTGFLNADKEFKFLTEAKWDRLEYRNASGEPYILGEGLLQVNGLDQKFKVSESANYSIVCNLEDMTISVNKAQFQELPIYHNELYLVGDATPGGWTLSQAITLHQDLDNPFMFSGKALLKKDGTFKIATNSHADYGEQKFYFRDKEDSDKISTDDTDDRQWKVDSDGMYLVTADIRDMRISITETSPDEIVEQRLCWYEPVDAAQDEEITLYFNAAAGNGALKGYTGTVYISSGIVSAENDNLTGLMHIIGKDETAVPSVYTMVRSEKDPDIYTLRMTPELYYAIDSDTKIKMLGMNFTSSDEKIKATDVNTEIIYVPFRANTGTMWYRPEKASFDEPITLHFDALAGNAALKGYTNTVYVHCGLLTEESNDSGDWKYQSGWLDNNPRYRMKRSTVNPDQYTLTLTPSEFFGTDEWHSVRSMVFVARNSDGTITGKESDNGDIVVDFKNNDSDANRVPLGKAISWKRAGDALMVFAENGTLELTPYNDYTVKVFTHVNGDDTPVRRSIAVCATPSCEFTVSDDESAILLATAGLRVNVSKINCQITFADADGKVLLREDGGLDNSARPRQISFAAMNDAAFYGGGYNGQRINQNGVNMVMNNTQTGGWENTWQAPHNICVPFVVSTSGYGLFFDDHYRNARITPSSDGTSYSSGSTTPIAYYFVGSSDGSQASVMENYTYLTGRQELPPYWALGYMTSRYGYKSQSEANEVIRSVKDANLPIDAIVFDIYWQGEGNSGMGNLDWYKTNFPDAPQMMADFDAQGIKTICITEPFITSATTNYIPFKKAGYFADDDVSGMEWLGASQVGLIDATNPEAMDAFWHFYKDRTAEGVGGWWLDLGEPERHDADSRHLGGSVAQVHNEFGNLWTERVYRGLKEDFPDMRPFLMPRAATAGIQRFGAFPWTGDIKRSWNGLQAQVPALISAGMSGIGYMGSDVGGFSASSTDPELYLRWVEMAVFSPMMRTHSPHMPEPYLGCYSSVLPAVRDFLNLRYSYLPYTYTLAWENATKGVPLARPVNFHDTASSNPSSADCSDQYLWGQNILVAPVMTPDHSRRITFPQGEWVDLNEMSKEYTGGTTITYSAPLECLPHFGRKGAFLPRFAQSTFVNTHEIDRSRLSITYLADFESQSVSNGVVFEDDCISTTTLTDGTYSLLSFSGLNVAGGHEITISQTGGYTGMPDTRTLTFVIPCYGSEIYGVSTNGMALTRYSSKEDLETAHGNGYYISSDEKLHIKIAHKSGETNSVNIFLQPSAGLNEIESSALTLEYQPTSCSVVYSIPEGLTANLSIFDMTGMEQIYVNKLSGIGTYPLDSLANGLYIGKIETPNIKNGMSRIVKMAVR